MEGPRPASTDSAPRSDRDWIGWAIVLVPVLVAMPTVYMPQGLTLAHAVMWVVLTVLLLLDAWRWDLPVAFWLVALTCLWPVAIPGYLKSRADAGGPDRFFFSVFSVGTSVTLLYGVPTLVG